MTTDQLKKANALAKEIEKQEEFVKTAQALVSHGKNVNAYITLNNPSQSGHIDNFMSEEDYQEIAKKILELAKKKLDQLKEDFANL